ncbi:putative membrane protein [Rhodococcus sp. MTM3W5.2]|nr:putative membrane protein [Rhodococcus sp. MTM3W5.2]
MGVVYLLAHTILQCGFAFAHGAEPDPAHTLSATAIETELSPAHTHIGDVAEHVAHEEHSLASLPRVDNPFRLLAIAVAMVAVVAASVLWSPQTTRSSPVVSAPARRGRVVLIELCIDRC